MSIWPLLGVLAAIVVWTAWSYNRLVSARNRVRSAWGDIDVQLSRRHELVPALVGVVRGFADHERGLLERVTELRTDAMASESPQRLAAVESDLEHALGRLFMLRESYPALTSSESFLRLQHDLVEIEDQLQYARRFYNGSVRDLNDRVRRFPDLLIATPLGFREAEFYAVDREQRAAPGARA